MVKAKFVVTEVRRINSSVPKDGKWIQGEVQTIIMRPVSGNKDEETTKFWEASPSGLLELGCANLEAAKFFELNKEYYINFTVAN